MQSDECQACLQYAGGEQGLSADEIELAKLRREVAELRRALASPLFNPPGSPGTTDGAAMTDEVNEVKTEAAGIVEAPKLGTWEERERERDERARRDEAMRLEAHRAYLADVGEVRERRAVAQAMDIASFERTGKWGDRQTAALELIGSSLARIAESLAEGLKRS